eukprot:CAMPEP_0179170426 /NCGR_PEP_ID=MMETSP0796-20121207/83956_1 /TAXON_ID=73915 /ORGANISM="Pyrodinium bahamense, Strain pbaha01" /LENGTH=56 /DNA_ID=CAMNT_0020873401 /DNA_START=118 /DNA_END=288 /DNA_ORIENTATION=-
MICKRGSSRKGWLGSSMASLSRARAREFAVQMRATATSRGAARASSSNLQSRGAVL